MLLAAPPDGFAARVPTICDAETVTDLIAECRLAVGDRSGMTVEDLPSDWHDITLSEEAVAVEAPDGRLAACADVLNRSYVSVSVYGYVHPELAGAGSAPSSSAGARSGCASVCISRPGARGWSCSTTSTPPTSPPRA